MLGEGEARGEAEKSPPGPGMSSLMQKTFFIKSRQNVVTLSMASKKAFGPNIVTFRSPSGR